MKSSIYLLVVILSLHNTIVAQVVPSASKYGTSSVSCDICFDINQLRKSPSVSFDFAKLTEQRGGKNHKKFHCLGSDSSLCLYAFGSESPDYFYKIEKHTRFSVIHCLVVEKISYDTITIRLNDLPSILRDAKRNRLLLMDTIVREPVAKVIASELNRQLVPVTSVLIIGRRIVRASRLKQDELFDVVCDLKIGERFLTSDPLAFDEIWTAFDSIRKSPILRQARLKHKAPGYSLLKTIRYTYGADTTAFRYLDIR